MAMMDSQFMIAGGIILGGNSGRGLMGQNKRLLGNAFIQKRAVQVNTSSSLRSLSASKEGSMKKVHQLHFLKAPMSSAP